VKKLDSFVVMFPRGRRGRPEETALTALLLSPSDSTCVAGIELFVGRGVTERRKREAWTALHLFPQTCRVQSDHGL
jgi:hypothetical protein